MVLESWKRPSGGNMHWFNMKHTLLLSFVTYKVLEWTSIVLPVWSMLAYILIVALCYWFGFVACRWVKRYKMAFTVASYKKAVIITGCDSARSNMLARKLANERGFQVFATCPDSQNSEARKLSRIPNIDVVEMESTNEESCLRAREVIETKMEESGNYLWALVCCENCCETAETDWQDSASIHRIVDVNLLGTIRTVKTFIPNLRKTKGRIVIASSILGHLNVPGFVVYSMTQAALTSFGEGLRRELQVWDVDVCTVQVGDLQCDPTVVDRSEEEFSKRHNISENVREDYGSEYFRKFFRTMSLFSKRIQDAHPEMAIDTLTHAVTTVWPEVHYRSSDWAKHLINTVLDYAPTEVIDVYLEKLLEKNFVPNAISKA